VPTRLLTWVQAGCDAVRHVGLVFIFPLYVLEDREMRKSMIVALALMGLGVGLVGCGSDEPEVPDVPDVPAVPDAPDVPDVPDVPDAE
jgi:hypothetical protein